MRWLRAWWPRQTPDRAATAARAESERKLREVERMAPGVNELARQLRREMALNNFAALVDGAFRARRP